MTSLDFSHLVYSFLFASIIIADYTFNSDSFAQLKV